MPDVRCPLAVMVLLVVFSANADSSAVASVLPDFHDTLTLFMHDMEVGEMVSCFAGDGKIYRNSVDVSVTLAAGNTDQMMRLDLHELREYRAGSGSLVKASQEMKSPSGVNSWKLGKKENSWELTVTTAGVVRSKNVEGIKENCRSQVSMLRGILSGSLKKDTVWSDTVFELTSATSYAVTTHCKDTPRVENDSCWIFICRDELTGRDEKWVIDNRGRTVLREVYPYIARRKVQQKNASPERSYADIYTLTRIPVPFKLDRKKEVVSVTVEDGFGLDSTVKRFFRKSGDLWYLLPLLQTCMIGDEVLADDEKKRFLLPTSTLQCDHPEIKALAKQLYNSEMKSCRLIAHFNSYVYNSIKKRNSATFSSAVETLKAGYGDCGEHAVLLAALLRAAGIPSRVVLGLLYSEAKKGYFYHAWVMCHIGHWIFADPSHNAFPAYADRIPLSIDDDGTNLAAVARIVGRIQVNHTLKKSLPENLLKKLE